MELVNYQECTFTLTGAELFPVRPARVSHQRTAVGCGSVQHVLPYKPAYSVRGNELRSDDWFRIRCRGESE